MRQKKAIGVRSGFFTFWHVMSITFFNTAFKLVFVPDMQCYPVYEE